MNDDSKNTSVFMQYIAESLKEERTPPTTKAQKHPAQKLLDWLQHWTKPTVRARDICIYGPRPRDRESAINSAEVLARNGWLIPTQTRRHDSREWQIVRKPVIFPTVASVAD
jgi:hypothetical protein